jgi:hypothetical protein
VSRTVEPAEEPSLYTVEAHTGINFTATALILALKIADIGAPSTANADVREFLTLVIRYNDSAHGGQR